MIANTDLARFWLNNVYIRYFQLVETTWFFQFNCAHNYLLTYGEYTLIPYCIRRYPNTMSS